MRPMTGKTCLVTGATSGIGLETARGLADRGARVIVVGRDETRTEAVRRELGADHGFTADLTDFDQVRRLAAEVGKNYDRLDVLVNNAGVLATGRRVTADGHETTFATNHLGPFLLTTLLQDLLERSAPARVVTVASAAHRQVRRIPWDDLAAGTGAAARQAYPLSKLANVLFTRELARRLNGTGVTANCVHPGVARTSLGRDVNGVFGAVVNVGLRFVPGPTAGARTSVYVASAPEVGDVTGAYFVQSRPVTPSVLARDDRAAARLWTLSEQLTRAPR
ncbi:SDR family oxidoreductase [Cryptosporangium sp. NPDC051539]|uniref:SDR family oxidoreductase n=1 Tax=Cryptosporangium sp. NPDC051539 TaxID=3363962 RepID=UPI0037A91268